MQSPSESQPPSLFSLISTQSSTESSLFSKYKEGTAPQNAPFRLFQPQSPYPSTDQQYSPILTKSRMRGPYRKYTCKEKYEAVECVQNGQDVNIVSRRFGIPRRNLVRWKKFGCERKQSMNRSSDQNLQQIILTKIKYGELTDENQVRDFALSMTQPEFFNPSRAWFMYFCKKNELRMCDSSNGQSMIADIESTDSHQV